MTRLDGVADGVRRDVEALGHLADFKEMILVRELVAADAQDECSTNDLLIVKAETHRPYAGKMGQLIQ